MKSLITYFLIFVFFSLSDSALAGPCVYQGDAGVYFSSNCNKTVSKYNISTSGNSVYFAPNSDKQFKIVSFQGENGVYFSVEKKKPKRRRAEKTSSSAGEKKYLKFVKRAAKKYNVPVPLILAVIKAESDFNPREVSKKGARGLMQLMPETAKKMGVKDSFDPKQNIFGGTRYLKKLRGMFNNTELVVAAYNAGPEAVKKHDGIPPFSETRRFVRKVANFHRAYKKKYS